MSYNGHVVIDTDCHLREYWELDKTYKDTMDPEYREKYARFSEAVRSKQSKPGDVGFTPLFWPRLPDRPLGLDEAFELANPELPQDRPPRPALTVTGRGYDIDPTCNWDPSIRLRDMEVAGVDASFIFPSQADGFCMLGDVGFGERAAPLLPPFHEQLLRPRRRQTVVDGRAHHARHEREHRPAPVLGEGGPLFRRRTPPTSVPGWPDAR